MTDQPSLLGIKPIITYPSEAQVGKTYLMTIDLQMQEDFVWQYEEEEYPIYCSVYSELFDITLVGEAVIVLHRFGGNYGQSQFILTAKRSKRRSKIKIALFSRWGILIRKIALPITASRKSTTRTMPLNKIKHNLPQKTFSKFINREDKIEELIDELSLENRQPVISISGIGGVGKTALVIELAYRYLENLDQDSPEFTDITKFENIIFVSAQKSLLTPNGITPKDTFNDSLIDICRVIALFLEDFGIQKESPNKQPKLVRDLLEKQGFTLIILDNLETIDDRREVVKFLVRLPANVKSVVTTRKHGIATYVPIELDSLSRESGLELIQYRANEVGIFLTPKEREKLYTECGGIPLVIIYVIGRLHLGKSLDAVIYDLNSPSGDIAQFCFDALFTELNGKISQKILLTLSLFPKGATVESLLDVSGLELEEASIFEDGLQELNDISLVQRRNKRMVMLSPTREYVLVKLHSDKKLEGEIREGWVDWYLKYTQGYGGDDWGNWVEEYNKIYAEWENLLSVLRWCANQNRYEDVWELWKSLNKVAYLYGLWADRLNWLDYLIGVFEKFNKPERLVEVLSSKAWTLIQMGTEYQLSEARDLLDRAWSLREYSPSLEYMLANNIAVLNLQFGNYKEADKWLNQSGELIRLAEMNERDKRRSHARLIYYFGERYYRSGDYDKSQEYYEQVLREAEQIDWLRFVSGSKEWLSSIAIKKRDFAKAEKLLNEGYPIAQLNHDMRRLAFYQRGFARLRKEQKQYAEAHRWAKDSLKTFEGLRIEKRVQEMLDFILALENFI